MKKIGSYESYSSYEFWRNGMNIYEYEIECAWISMNMNIAFCESPMNRKLKSMNKQWMMQIVMSCMTMNIPKTKNIHTAHMNDMDWFIIWGS